MATTSSTYVRKTVVSAWPGTRRWTWPMETVTDFIFLDSKITVDGDHSHEIKRCLLLGRKATMRLKLKFQYFDHYMRTDSLEKILMLGNIEGRRIRG